VQTCPKYDFQEEEEYAIFSICIDAVHSIGNEYESQMLKAHYLKKITSLPIYFLI
jgi:hypothetical protein